MRILYIASGIPVPGVLGGSTHVFEVARGLAQRGHEVHVVASRHERWGGFAPFTRPVSSKLGNFFLHQIDIPKIASLAGAWPVMRLVKMLRPDAIIERYYNFAGLGVIAAQRFGIPCLLEVNALMVDPPEVRKRRIDDKLGRVLGLGRASHGPMRRWAALQCDWSQRIVTPLHTTVPPEVERSKIVELPWGADVERFGEPQLDQRDPLPTAIFIGSFRAWHGVVDVVRAGALLLAAGKKYRFLLVGDGPERAQAEQLAAAWPGSFEFTGSLPYEQVPNMLGRAHIGVAPFNTAAHPALQAAGFFWSPLKVYEYMAASLPVVTPDLPPLNVAVRHEQEGLLYPEGDVGQLASAIARLLDDPTLAQRLGAAARKRVVEHYSWQRHCAELERILQEMLAEKAT